MPDRTPKVAAPIAVDADTQALHDAAAEAVDANRDEFDRLADAIDRKMREPYTGTEDGR